MVIFYFKKFFKYFKNEKKAFIRYSILSVIAGIFELTGVALTYPLVINILAEEESKGGVVSPILIGFAIILLFLIKNIFMIFYTYIQTGYTRHLEIKIKKNLMRYFLGERYQYTSKIPLAYKNKMFTLFVNTTVYEFILRLLNLNINLIIFSLITAFIAVKFSLATLVSVVFALLIVTVQNKIYKPFLKNVGLKVSETTNHENRSFNDAILNLRDIKSSNNEKYFYNQYVENITARYEYSRKWNFLNAVPPYVTEPCIILLFFVFLIIIAIQTYSEPEKLVASLALVASAIFRLTPSISRIQVNLNGINSAMPVVKEFIDDYEKLGLDNISEIEDKEFEEFEDSLELKNITFGYETGKNILENLSLKINKGEFIGIAGLSGAGKTTLIDIISGLYRQKEGLILVDGQVQTKPLKIGYIPQEFRLINASVLENIAFGNPVVDEKRAIEVLKEAQLYDFVVSNYKNGIHENPFVDSTGISQGQKQRLAIARALYSNPDILILDEATSSLDLKTEDEICTTLDSLKGKKTIIVVAHRISTLKNADRIIFMENGTITGDASFDELLNTNNSFKNLVELASAQN